jgi:hypothetical protein
VMSKPASVMSAAIAAPLAPAPTTAMRWFSKDDPAALTRPRLDLTVQAQDR